MTNCQLCQAEIPEGHEIEVRGRGKGDPSFIYCADCASNVERQFQAETANANLLLAALAGLAAAVVGVLIWYGFIVITNYHLGLLAAGLGWLVGIAVVLGAGRKRGPALQAISVVITLFALVLSQWLIVRYFAVQALAEQGFTGISLFVPLGVMLDLVITSLGEDLLTLVFWAIALWAAFATPARRRLRRVGRT